jgi:lipooligosaccharide transport system ATP-binding protein
MLDRPVIQAHGLTKRYGSLVAVDGIDFVVQRGECFGFLGPNGAGKTSTVRMIHAVSPPSGGSLSVLGRDVVTQGPEIRQRLGVAHQEDNLDPDFSVERNLLIFARYFGIPAAEARGRTDELLRFMDLHERRESQVEELSGGLKRRLMLARALVNGPQVLILDEPTTGLDPQSRHQMWRRVRRLRNEGVTVVLTTHYMEEAARLCDRLVIMDRGKILVEGAPQDLVHEHVGREVVEVSGAGPGLLELIAEQGWNGEEAEDRVLIYAEDGDLVRNAILERFQPHECALRMANLEDVFLRLTGHELRNE